MTTRIYNIARQKFALGNVNWQLDAIVASIARPEYKANVVTDKHISIAGNLLSTVQVLNRVVDDAGWFLSDPIIFVNTPNISFSQILFWRDGDGLLLFQATFPPFTGGQNKSFIIIRGAAFPGLWRI